MIAENQLDEDDRRVLHLKKITREIQNAAMQLRTTKVKHLFLKMRRVVRDLSLKLGKRVALSLKGEELEIDRNLVENLEEPLMHLIRNSMGHGIEGKDARLAKGKPEEGVITLKAERSGNNIAISVEDDGMGLDREEIRGKAVAMGFVSAKDAPTLSENEVFDFIFKQGFSTARSVDSVSGRGVGMDIVKHVTTGSRGRVVIQSEKDRYTRFTLMFPLSTAIIDGMIVKTGPTYFVIPVSHIVESLKIEDTMLTNIENKASVISLRGEIIPVIHMNRFFNMKHEENKNGRRLGVIIENNDKRKYAFIVDEIIAKKEVVIKSLGSMFKNVAGISSGTVLQGGSIGYVLDVDRIINIKA
jgi:two-component system chemotaxis sensor kinase CheA